MPVSSSLHCPLLCNSQQLYDCRSGATGDLRHRIHLAIVWGPPPGSDLISQRDFPIGICGPLRQHALLDALSRVGVPELRTLHGKNNGERYKQLDFDIKTWDIMEE